MHIDTLVEAAEGGDLAVLERAITAGFPLDTRDRFGRTALLVAAHNGHVAFAKRLLATGAALEAHDTTAEVRYYHGANARPSTGRWSLLHAAAQGGGDDVIAWLLDEHGYAVDVPDHGGWTPLHVAAYYPLASLATLDLLLARGADPNAEDALGRNAVAHARDLPFLQRLLDAGGHPDGGNFVAPIADARADGPERPLARAVARRDEAAIALLFERGATQLGDALVHATLFSPELVDLLLPRADDAAIAAAMVDVIDDALFERLLGALRAVPARLLFVTGRVDRVRALLARGVKPDDARDGDGRTPLHHAAQRGALPLVQLLVEAGADPNALDAKGKTPRALAFGQTSDESGHEAVRRYLEPMTRPAPAIAAPRVGLGAGDRVRHPKFGAGKILRVTGDKATVAFDDAGEKTLVLRVLVAE